MSLQIKHSSSGSRRRFIIFLEFVSEGQIWRRVILPVFSLTSCCRFQVSMIMRKMNKDGSLLSTAPAHQKFWKTGAYIIFSVYATSTCRPCLRHPHLPILRSLRLQDVAARARPSVFGATQVVMQSAHHQQSQNSFQQKRKSLLLRPLSLAPLNSNHFPSLR